MALQARLIPIPALMMAIPSSLFFLSGFLGPCRITVMGGLPLMPGEMFTMGRCCNLDGMYERICIGLLTAGLCPPQSRVLVVWTHLRCFLGEPSRMTRCSFPPHLRVLVVCSRLRRPLGKPSQVNPLGDPSQVNPRPCPPHSRVLVVCSCLPCPSVEGTTGFW
jgi:hypothetical protein